MNAKILGVIAVIIVTSILAGMANISALTISSVDTPSQIKQGGSAEISVSVENDADGTIEDVQVSLDLSKVPFTSSSVSKIENELDEDDDQTFRFEVHALNNAKSDVYSIPISVSWKDNNVEKKASGNAVITVSSEPDLDVRKEEGIIISNQENSIILKIINKGLSDARFLEIELGIGNYNILSPSKIYIGELNSDDTDTTEFKIYFSSSGLKSLPITLTFSDITNKKYTKSFNIDARVYSRQEAINLGFIQKSNTGLYVGLIIALIILYLIYRRLRKWMKNRKKAREMETGK